MEEAHYSWDIKGVDHPSEAAETIGKSLSISPIIAQIMMNRGIKNEEAMQAFLAPNPEQLHDPYLMHDMQKGVDRIQDAIAAGQQITIYGDYDADGVTSTAIMMEALNEIGANVNFYIPNRFDDGYGPNVATFNKLIDAGTELFVTVDNGVAGNEAIAAANARGIDVVVTDHHELPENLPDAFAIIHPRYPGADYPFGGLSGAGVAFKVATALLEEIPQELLDLVTIGTIADLVPMLDENRTLVYFGLQAISQTERPGLQALLDVAKVKLEELTEQTIGFTLAPRINALGRLDDAAPGVTLLTTMDEDEAQKLAEMTEAKNKERQEFVAKISGEALAQANTPENEARQTLVITGSNWHQGVLGIVASRLVEATGKPTLVLSQDANTGLAKGSGRSVEGLNLFDALDGHRDILTAFGGHHMAVGLTVEIDQLGALKDALEAAADEQGLAAAGKVPLKIAATLTAGQATMALYTDLQHLAPFGTDNPQPQFHFKPAAFQEIKAIGADHQHLKFQMADQDGILNAIAFGKGALAPELTGGATAEVVGSLEDNVWNGRHSMQVMVKDLQVGEVVRETEPDELVVDQSLDETTEAVTINDQRVARLSKGLFAAPATYLFFHAKLRDQLSSYLNSESTGLVVGEMPIPERRHLVLVDLPDSVSDLSDALTKTQPINVTTYFYRKRRVADQGMPDRSQYATLFRFVKTHQNVNIGAQMDQLATFLAIPKGLLVFMIQVFFELGFVTIQDGIMNHNLNASQSDLASAPSYQLRQQQIAAEKALLDSDSDALIKLMMSYLADE